MAIVKCSCGAMIDLDYDECAYEICPIDVGEIDLKFPKCVNCREELESLYNTMNDVELFTADMTEIAEKNNLTYVLWSLEEFKKDIHKIIMNLSKE